MCTHFNPTNPVRLARDQLAELSQKWSVPDHTAAFCHLCSQIPDLNEAEKLDRYTRGLKQQTKLTVFIEDPRSFDMACRIAETFDSTMNITRRPNSDMVQTFNHNGGDTSHHHYDGPTPMDLSLMQKGENRRENKGVRGPNYG
ncbi:hypothetical protein FOA52_012268 [Chlamydomonas sp. UWO 241]|nr:hypothetical protein FOA52_012268 [Chlamydomonas sp. UWO 241]